MRKMSSAARSDIGQFYESDRAASTNEGKGVPMLRRGLREATRKEAEARHPRFDHRRSKGEKAQTKRMSTVVAVYTIASFVRTPEQIVRIEN
ncbi:MAG: hypothetical protein KF868_08045 [Acidobacteria bacterium]|nr:hypothetical protein [Acidobacteriota bacterium]MCW5970664.1 hypothetical protein [Blastocatellales bacterium]